jgi:hypothetical protein
MNPCERIKLKEMIVANDVEDHTESIRGLKHSIKIKADIMEFQELQKSYPTMDMKSDKFKDMACKKCPFLFNHYNEIFHKIIKEEIELSILFQLLHVLKEIEEGSVDQHEGSYKVGLLLKKIYIDSVIDQTKPDNAPKCKNISWKQYKSAQNQKAQNQKAQNQKAQN